MTFVFPSSLAAEQGIGGDLATQSLSGQNSDGKAKASSKQHTGSKEKVLCIDFCHQAHVLRVMFAVSTCSEFFESRLPRAMDTSLPGVHGVVVLERRERSKPTSPTSHFLHDLITNDARHRCMFTIHTFQGGMSIGRPDEIQQINMIVYMLTMDQL